MDKKPKPQEEKSDRVLKGILTVSLADIKPLLEMGNIASSAKIFHKYAASPPEEATLPLSDYFRILLELSIALQDETIHLSSRHLMPGSTSFIMSHISSCNNLAEAMKIIAKSYNMLHGGAYNRVEIRDGFLHYIIDDSQFPYQMQDEAYIHFTLECVLIYLHGILCFITSRDLRSHLYKVHTKRKRGPMESRHMAFWDVPIRYHSGQYGLIYDLTAAELPITIDQNRMPSPPEIYGHIIDMIEQSNVGGAGFSNFTENVLSALEQGLLEQNTVARHLGCSVATLRRRLSLENTTFRQLSHDKLNERAKQMLAQGFHHSHIAEELGFSEFRSFVRAFKNWNGLTPTAYLKAAYLKQKTK